MGVLPDGVQIAHDLSTDTDLGIWFVHSRMDLDTEIKSISANMNKTHVWIAWPKKSSSLKKRLPQQRVREAGLWHSLADYKICAIDSTWPAVRLKR